MKITVKEQVYDDLIAITEWYEEQLSGLGKRFLNEWEDELELVAQNPFAYQIKYK